MTRLLTSLLRFFRQSSPPANQPLISPEQMREVFRQMLCDQEIRLSLKSIMGEAEPPCVSANDPPASEVAGGDVDGKFGTVAGGPRNYTFSADAATRVPLTVQGFAGQTAALQDWKNSQGNVLATVRHDGNVGIGTTEPAEKLDVAGKIRASGDHPILIDPTSGEIETGKLNRIVFLRAGDGPNPDDDGDAINRKIRDLPDSGGIIMLVPGSGSNPYFKIATTVTTKDDINHKTKHGVKIRGYGGAGLDLAQPLTKLLWTGSGTGPVIDFTPYDDGWVQDLELSHLVIDGSNTAKIGLKLNRVEQSRFINLRIENIVNFPPDPDTDPPEDDGIGMFLCSDVDGKNVQFNYFESCTTRAPRALVLDGTETPGGSNSNMNMFVNLRPHYRGTHKSDVGIWLKHAGDNSFSRVTIFNDNDVHETREGHGVVVEHPYAAIGNYFYHLIPSRGVYVRDSTQPLPYEGRMMIYSHSIGVDEPFPQTDDPTVPPEKHVFWADDYGEMHGMPNLAVGTSYMAQGTVSVTVSSSLVQGTGTRFDLDTKVGDRITIVGTSETRTVVGFPDDEHKDTKLTVDSNFGTAAAGSAMRVTTGRLSATGPADFASLRIGGMEVISDERLLHDVLIPRKYPECAARPLVDILGDFPSVLDWGATGDGVTDDRAAFQKAIDNCAGNLLVPRGTYMLSDYLEVPSNITIIGIGQPCLKLMPYRPFRTNLAPPTEPSFNAVITNADRENGNHHIRLVGLKLDGNGDSQYQTDPGPPPNPARGANLAVVLFNYVSFFEIVDCELTGGVSECFYALGGSIDPYFGTTHGIVSNCHIHDSGQPDVDSLGVHGDRVDGMVVSGCTLQNIGLRAIGFSKGTNVSVCGCTVTNAQGAVELGGTLHASISGVSGKDIRNDGVTVALAPDSTAPLNISVAACSFQAKTGNAGCGVRIAGGNFVSVGNVAVRGFGQDGFRVESGYNSLSNVVAANCGGYGMRLTGGEATGCTVGSYRAFSCALGSESEDSGAAGNEWHSPRMTAEALALNINGEPCIGSSRDIDAHSLKVGTLTAGKPVFAGSDLVLASQDLDLLAAYIVNQLPVARGGTGADNAAGARWMLEVYGKSEIYTKAEVDALLAGKASSTHVHTVGLPGHAHGGVTAGSDTSGSAGAGLVDSWGPKEP